MDQPSSKQRYSWNEYIALLEELKANIDFTPDVIVSIGKGGSIPGVVLAEHYNILNLNFGLKSYTNYKQTELKEYQTIDQNSIEKQNVLIVDDLTDSGTTFQYVSQKLKQSGCKALKTACIFLKEDSQHKPDYYAKTVPSSTWIVQPWES